MGDEKDRDARRFNFSQERQGLVRLGCGIDFFNRETGVDGFLQQREAFEGKTPLLAPTLRCVECAHGGEAVGVAPERYRHASASEARGPRSHDDPDQARKKSRQADRNFVVEVVRHERPHEEKNATGKDDQEEREPSDFGGDR